MIQLGRFNTLTVVKHVEFGAFLDGGEAGEILLPRREVDDSVQVDEEISVFIYLDSKDRPIATFRTPKIQVGGFAYLKVVDVNRVGAFLDWGLEKDLMVPFAEQNTPMEVGQSYIVTMYIDSLDLRPTASSKIDKFLVEENNKTFKTNEQVELLIASSTDLGLKAIINQSHWGLIFKDDISKRLSYGQTVSGFIKQIRGDDKINIALEKTTEIRDRQSQQIIDFLVKEGGFAGVHDKSDPNLIRKLFGMSKSAFKKAIGGLYKKGDIVIESTGIRLIKK